MAVLFFYGRDAERFGPFSANRMRALAAGGHILASDSVWQEGQGIKVRASQVKNLFAPPPVEGPPAPAITAPAIAAQLVTEADLDAVPGDNTEEAAATAADPPPRTESVRAEPYVPTPRRAATAEESRPKRVISIKGGVLLGQDGVDVKFQKKCNVCGQEDTSRTTAKIRHGTMRVTYFCRKCRKPRAVEMSSV